MNSCTSREVETLERISLNKLLLKCRGAPYEEALRRIIKQKLSENLLESRHHFGKVHDSRRDLESPYLESSAKFIIDTGIWGSGSEGGTPQSTVPLLSLSRGAVGSRAQYNSASRTSTGTGQRYGQRDTLRDSSSMQAFHRNLPINKTIGAKNEDQHKIWLGHQTLCAEDRDNKEFDKENRDVRQQLNISTISEIQSNSFNNTGSKIREPLTVQVDREEWSKCSISGSVGDRQSHRGRSASLTRRNKSPLRYSKPQYNRLSPDGSPSSRSGSGSAVSKERGRRRDKGSSTASLTPRSNSSSQYSSISSCTRNRAPSYDDRWRDSSPSRNFQPTLLAHAANRKILATNRANETFEHRMARSVQNYYIKQAINCAKSFNSTSGTEGSTDSEMSPGVGQYTKSFTIPYDQRHSKNIRNAEHPVPNTRHTFGDEKVEDRFFGRSLSRSGSINGSDGGCSPGVGQYTKALVIPYFQRHSVVHSRSKSPIHYQRHTWGSEKYDSFINSHNINEDGDHHVEYVDSSTHHSDQLLPGSQQCVDSYSSNFSVASNSTKNYSQLGEYHCRHLSPSSNSSCSRGTSRERGRERNRGDQTGNSPRTPREHQFRRLIKIINEIGPVGSN